MSNNNAFSPLGSSTSMAVSNANQAAALPGTGGDCCEVYNSSATVPVSVTFGGVNDTPVASIPGVGVIVAPGATKVMTLPVNTTQFAAIGTAIGPSTVYLQRGGGL